MKGGKKRKYTSERREIFEEKEAKIAKKEFSVGHIISFWKYDGEICVSKGRR